MFEYLPWWAGSLALAAVALGSAWGLRRTLGVSGSVARVLGWKEERTRQSVEAAFDAMDSDALLAEMRAVTAKEFGVEAVAQPQAPTPVLTHAPKDGWTVHAAFLLMLVVGGFIGAVIKGQLGLRTTNAASLTALFPSPVMQFAALSIGGFLVGVGTRMAGGCTSGLGLSGCSRLSKAGFIGTACFLGCAICFTFLLRGLTS